MGNNNFIKIGAIILWIAVSIGSCYLTVESFYLLLGWSRLILWIFALAFFTVSSYGTKLIYDSLNTQNSLDNDKRRPFLFGGIFLVLAFWGFFSLPTNTHTLYLQQNAREVCISDLENTKIELNNLNKEANIQIDAYNKSEKVTDLITKLKQEYSNPYRQGFGRRCDSLCYALEQALDPTGQWKLPQRGTNPKADIKRIVEAAENRLENVIRVDVVERLSLTKEEMKSIDKVSKSIDGLINAINKKKISEDEAVIKTIDMLETAYPKLKEYKNDSKYEVYKSKTAQLKNVYGVFKSWFKGDLKGQGFAIWLVISVLIDLAGFIFFTMAFKKD